MTTANELWPQLEALGEDEVRRRLAIGAYGQMKEPLVREWLAMKDAQRVEARERERQASEREALRLVQESNAIAAQQNYIALYGIIVALVTALVALTHR